MLVYVYKSLKKADTYLYVNKRDDFSDVPPALMATFGKPVFVMPLAYAKHEKVANIDSKVFFEKLTHAGFYLQLPPPTESLLKQHKQAQNGAQ